MPFILLVNELKCSNCKLAMNKVKGIGYCAWLKTEVELYNDLYSRDYKCPFKFVGVANPDKE